MHGADAASRMSARVDPAKRYAVAPEPAASSSDEGGSLTGAHGSRSRLGKANGEVSCRSPPHTPALPLDSPAAHSPGARWLVEGSGETPKDTAKTK